MILARYLSPPSFHELDSWLSEFENSNGIFIDPFGASPALPVYIAQKGFNVLVASNNPINKFLLELQANPPSKDDLSSSLASLAATRRGKERLEPHILSLYETLCDQCHQLISADYYVWEKGASYPSSKWISCTHCQHEGSSEITDMDKEIYDQFRNDGLHRARALESIVHKDDAMRFHVEEAIEIYPPRAIYALFTILNKFKILSLDDNKKRALQTILLQCFDVSSRLWPSDNPEFRPLQLKTPNKYHEKNVWLSLEKNLNLMQDQNSLVEVTDFPDFPTSSGICIFPGAMRDLAKQKIPHSISGSISSIPYPNTAYWKLSALWSGWLFGKESVSRFVGVIKRKRFDWKWHATALSETLKNFSDFSQPNTPFWSSLHPQKEGFYFATFFALFKNKFGVESADWSESPVSLILKGKQYNKDGKDSKSKKPQELVDKIQGVISASGQPIPLIQIIPKTFVNASSHKVKFELGKDEEFHFREFRNRVIETLSFREGFLHFNGSADDVSTGIWGIKNHQDFQESKDDQIEKWLVRDLINNPDESTNFYSNQIFQNFSFSDNSYEEYLSMLLQSYAIQNSNSFWNIRESELPQVRKKDISEVRINLEQLGRKGGFKFEGKNPMVWKGTDFEKKFFFGASTVVSKKVYSQPANSTGNYLIIPGSRVDLFLYKLKRNPQLASLLSKNWKVIKFRTLREMSQMGKIIPSQFDEIIDSDKLESDDSQLRLI